MAIHLQIIAPWRVQIIIRIRSGQLAVRGSFFIPESAARHFEVLASVAAAAAMIGAERGFDRGRQAPDQLQ